MTVHVGGTVVVEARAEDPNPSDIIRVTFELPGDPSQHPSGGVYEEAFATGATFRWSPLQRDSGKTVQLCFRVTSQVNNPREPSLAGTQPSFKRCLTLTVPLCLYMASQGDTIRSIASQFNTNWRTLFLINPELIHPSEVAPGSVLRIGSLYTMTSGDSLATLSARAIVPWVSLANNNMALLNRLSTDQNLVVQDPESGKPAPVSMVDPAMAVYDIEYRDLDRAVDYSGHSVCVVAPLNSNCV
mmetsp:Transcript_10683/g.26041  ORF Transcript_10683/g.26041 Transcript_10683/m.26041 type:complete len:243 (+) Transcript_10683:2-730(+)